MGGLFSKPKVQQPKPTRMAVPDSEASLAAKRAAQEDLRRRLGSRSGNDLSSTGTVLGE